MIRRNERRRRIGTRRHAHAVDLHGEPRRRGHDGERHVVPRSIRQIAAVRAALDQVGRAMLELHIDQSLDQAIQRGDSTEAARELKNALDRFIS